jgi:hypothetical protein
MNRFRRRKASSRISRWFLVSVAGCHAVVVVAGWSDWNRSLITWTLGSRFLRVGIFGIDSLRL